MPLELIRKFWFCYALWDTEIEYCLKIGSYYILELILYTCLISIPPQKSGNQNFLIISWVKRNERLA